ncbi:PaaX family transcriptional regulator [Egibacter rhizosphaerae]|uniref:PaaX family transcriptional regulator n=1 Tax=Egibacter rhizosphaerae TaxID=1670831 RepID=A0A411YEZ8_9ACTN|nr:PaaX family transcriptional regulator C-terminal domain-containing protein [Egibacter rhizosphaerae]QBI19834.1 PaaX family transcriptional regulator [Egibacter rhizosphaerae]
MRPTRSRSLIYDLFGAYVRPAGGWIAVADLVHLLGELGVDEQAVRSAVSRMKRKGLLVGSRRDGVAGYALSDEAERMFAEGDVAIFTTTEPADLADGWVIATFSVPEGERDRRHKLRSALTWLGFGNLSSGVWIAPWRTFEPAAQTVRGLGLEGHVDLFHAHHEAFREPPDLIARCWDLDGLAARYASFVATARPVLERWERDGGDHRQAFVDYTLLLHEWRQMPYLDPGLPSEVLPANWQGETAARLFDTLLERLEKPARLHVERVINAAR